MRPVDNWSISGSTEMASAPAMNVVKTSKWPCKLANRSAIDCFNNEVCATFYGRVTVSGMKGGR